MKKLLPIYLYGATIILVGIFLLFSDNIAFKNIKPTLGIIMSIGGVIAFFEAFSKQRKLIQFNYQEIHGLAMFVYGVSILFLCNTFDQLITITSFLLIFYAFSEIIFCNWLFNLKRKVILKIVLLRLALGLAVGIGTIFSTYNTKHNLEGFGTLFILVGINVLLYVPVMRKTSV